MIKTLFDTFWIDLFCVKINQGFLIMTLIFYDLFLPESIFLDIVEAAKCLINHFI